MEKEKPEGNAICCINNVFKKISLWGAWVVQSVKHLTLAQVTISRFVGSSPASGSALTTLSASPALTLDSLSLIQK